MEGKEKILPRKIALALVPSCVLLFTLALAALAPPVEAAPYTNRTVRTCWAREATARTIVASNAALLRWRADGELVMEPTQSLVKKLWSSGTKDRGAQLCWEPRGAFVIYDAGGAAIWQQEGPPPPTSGPTSVELALETKPVLTACSLSAAYQLFWGDWGPLVTETMWTRENACPVTSSSVVASGWCMDNTIERIVAATPWSELIWKPGGFLRLRGTGVAAGQELWTTPTMGHGVKLCFEGTGRLAIYDSLERPIWTSGAAGPTTTSYLLGLDDCDLAIAPAEGGAARWSIPKRCLQAKWAKEQTAFVASSDVLIAENDDARLALEPSGNLVLRKRSGDVIWTSALASGVGYRLTLQDDGNLVIYDRGGAPKWSADVSNQGVFELALERCELRLNGGNPMTEVVKWRAGSPSCEDTVVTNATPWTRPASGNVTLLRSPEATLVWQGDGNLVLYTMGGTPIWASRTGGKRGKSLAFQADGNLVVYGASGALWASGTVGSTVTQALRVQDRCTLTISEGSRVRWTGIDSCAVVNFSFERRDGNDTIGAGLRSTLVAENRGGARLDTATAVDVALLGFDRELFSATAYQTELDDGSNLDTASVTVLGESAASVNVTYTRTFFEKSKTFMVGIVPVVVTVGATGEVGLALEASGGELSLTPSAALAATVEAGVGVGSDVAGASAGIRGSLTLLELAMPFALKVLFDGGAPSYEISGDLSIATMSGSLALYAKAFVKVWFVECSVEWSRSLFGWTGAEWSKNLFTKRGSF